MAYAVKKFRILLADDHPLLRFGIKEYLSTDARMEIVGEAEDYDVVLQQTTDLLPDVVVLDIGLPNGSGIDLVHRIKEISTSTRVLILSGFEQLEFIRSAFAAGADGYLTKASATKEIHAAILAVCKGNGEKYLDPKINFEELYSELPKNFKPHSPSSTVALSNREKDVLLYLAEGHTYSAIATHFGISARSVETYRIRIFEKLGLKSRVDLVRYAVEIGLLSNRNK